MQLIINDEDTFQDLLNALTEITKALDKKIKISLFGSEPDYIEHIIQCACVVHGITVDEIILGKKQNRLYAKYQAVQYISTVMKIKDEELSKRFERERTNMIDCRKVHRDLYTRDRHYTDTYDHFLKLIALQHVREETITAT